MKKGLNYGTKRFVLYWVLGIFLVICSLLLLNSILFGISMVHYVKTDNDYGKFSAEQVAQHITINEGRYSLSKECEEKLDHHDQWLMLIDQKGKVIWDYKKPQELKKQYTLTQVATFSKWYLEDYPVSCYIWDDTLLVVGEAKNSSCKYNLRFSLDFFRYMFKWTGVVIILNILWLLGIAMCLMRFWTKEKEQARLEWIAGISHDIRTPLSMVMGYASTIEENEEITGKVHDQAAIIRRQSKVIKDLVSDLNLTYKLAYSMELLRKESVGIAALLREVAISYLNDDLEGKIDFEMAIDKSLEGVQIKCDGELVKRALMNLIGNSIRHNSSKASIWILIKATLEDHKVKIIVADDGTGYSKEMLQRLASKKKVTPMEVGGLVIVKKVIAAHHGKVIFRNQLNHGSECEIWLDL